MLNILIIIFIYLLEMLQTSSNKCFKMDEKIF